MKALCKNYLFLTVIANLLIFVEQSTFENDEENRLSILHGYCDFLPQCICVGTRSGLQVICEGELHALKLEDEMIEYLEIFIYCHPKKYVNLQENYFHILHLNSEPYKVSFHVESCSEPKSSYYNLISPVHLEMNHNAASCAEELNKTLSEYEDGIPSGVIHVEYLSIGCEQFNKTFNLYKDHFKGMFLIKTLNISCEAISNIPVDLFCGTMPQLNHLMISKTKFLLLPRKLFANLPFLQTLVLTENAMKELTDESFVGLESLANLDIKENEISILHDSVFTPLQSLKILNMKNNHLSILPESLNTLSKLTFLDLSGNFLVKINYDMFKGLESLNRLYLMNNNISHLDGNLLSGLQTIEYIDISGNSIEYLPDGMFNSRSLSVLTFNDNSPKQFFGGNFLQAQSLRELSLAYSSILSVRYDLLFNSPLLRFIDLRGNFISELASDFLSKNPKLVYFYLQENKLSNLSANFFHGTPILEDLNLSSNNFTLLPSTLFQNLTFLLYLNLSNNSFTSMPKGFLSQLSKLRTLDLSGNELKNLLPDFLHGTGKLIKLNLSKNKIATLPNDIFKPMRFYYGFHSLELQDNQLEKLPDISFLEVHSLNLAYNNLQDLSRDNFHNMSSLKVLNISHNGLHTVTNTPLILKYQKLTSLDLSGNSLQEISNEMLMEATRLQFLDVSRNNLTSFKYSIIANMQELAELNLAFNSIDDLRTLWYESALPSLKVLDLSHNLLSNKITIQSKGAPTSEQRHWKNLSPMNKLPNLEKLILSHNKFEALYLDWFCYEKLHLLDLSNNVIRHLHHKDLLFTASTMINNDSLSHNGNILPSRTPRSTNLPRHHGHKAEDQSAPDTELIRTSDPLIIDLRGNLLTGVDIPSSKLIPISPRKSKITKEEKYRNSIMLLDNNPIICDCHLLNFLKVIHEDVIIASEVKDLWDGFMTFPAKLEVGNLSCWEPISVRGRLVAEPEYWMHHLIPMIGLCTLVF